MMEYLGTIASHLMPSLDPARRKETVDKIVNTLYEEMRHGLEFDAIAVRGVSGLLLGTAVADRMNKNLIVVRTHQAGHSKHMVEGPKDGRYIIVDDLVCTGKTLWIIVQTIKHHLCEHSEFMGMADHHGGFKRAIKLDHIINNDGHSYGLGIDKRQSYVIKELATGEYLGRDKQTDDTRSG